MAGSGERLEEADGENDGRRQGGSTSSASHPRASFPPLHAGISTPRGAYLNAASASQDGGQSYIARCGFANLATSSTFVENVRRDFEELLRSFQAQANGGVLEGAQGDERGFFGLFASLFRAQGWHRSQLFWSEHEETRAAIFRTVMRIFAEPLEKISKALEVESGAVKLSSAKAGQLSHQDIVRACGALFGLHLLRSTAVLTSKQRLQPGKGVRIALEADLYHALLAMPECMASHFADPTRRDESDLQPIDDVNFVLDQLVESGICILAPLPSASHSPVTMNQYTSEAVDDRRRGMWAHLVGPSDDGMVKNARYALSRTESGYAMVREKLGLPYRPSPSGLRQANQSSSSSAPAEATSSSSQSPALVAGRLRLDKGETRAKWAGPARGLLAPPASAYRGDLESAMTSVQEKQEKLEAQKAVLLGRQRIAGDGFASNIHDALSADSSVPGLEQKRYSGQATDELVKKRRLNAKDIIDHARDQTQHQIADRFQRSSPQDQNVSSEMMSPGLPATIDDC